jgi:hypothetical protein
MVCVFFLLFCVYFRVIPEEVTSPCKQNSVSIPGVVAQPLHLFLWFYIKRTTHRYPKQKNKKDFYNRITDPLSLGMEFDHVLKIVGEFGPHQKRLYILLCLSIVPASIQLLLLVFVAAEPKWICLNSPSNSTCPNNRSHCLERQYTTKFTSIVTEVLYDK